MRLIDADEIIKRSHDVIIGDGAKHRCFDTTLVHEIPTVDAIPVEWIVEYKEKYSNISSEGADVIKAETLVDMLADWAERRDE